MAAVKVEPDGAGSPQFVFELTPPGSPSIPPADAPRGSRRVSGVRVRYHPHDEQRMARMMGVFRVDPFAHCAPPEPHGPLADPPATIQFELGSSPAVSHSAALPPESVGDQEWPADMLGLDRRRPRIAPCPNVKVEQATRNHKCEVCGKLFPRPSALATHLNVHSGSKPFKCEVPTCDKSFTVRSNAKRHTRTHHEHAAVPYPAYQQLLLPTPPVLQPDFSTPFNNTAAGASYRPAIHEDVPPIGVPAVHTGFVYLPLPANQPCPTTEPHKWIPESLRGMRNHSKLTSMPPFNSICFNTRALPVPLPPILPAEPASNVNDDSHSRATKCVLDYEERNSYGQVGEWPYHPGEWKGLPGPRAMNLPIWFGSRPLANPLGAVGA